MVPFVEMGQTGEKQDLDKRESEFFSGHFTIEIFIRHRVE